MFSPTPVSLRGDAASQASTAPRFSIVILTFSRDAILAEILDRLRATLGDRVDYELILVDNNVELGDRAALLDGFVTARLLREGRNKGVVARNDGIAAARGEFVILLDDDVFVETPDFLDRFAAHFAMEAKCGAVTIRKHVRGETRRRVDLIPHTRKDIDLDHPFRTFRFVGGCVGFRAAMLAEVGGFLPDFFYGLEEIELSYRIVDAGWTILYAPDIAAEELEHPAGRRPKRAVQTDRLANKYIISYLRMPFPEILVNFALFTPYAMFFARGDVSVPGAVGQFVRWLRRRDRIARKPISRAAAAYIRSCGGAVWR
jgi:GT2 family glycosyltransferase